MCENILTNDPNSDQIPCSPFSETDSKEHVFMPTEENYLHITTEETIEFLGEKITLPKFTTLDVNYRILLAQLEILGTPYLDALKRQGIYFDEIAESLFRAALTKAGK